MTSCHSMGDFEDVFEKEPEQTQVKDNIDIRSSHTNVVESVNSIFNSLGLFNDSIRSITDIGTLCLREDDNSSDWFKFNRCGDLQINGEYFGMAPDSGKKGYCRFTIQDSQDHSGIDIETYNTKDCKKINMALDKKGNIVESIILPNGFLIENSVISKDEDGNIIRQFADGSIRIYNNQNYFTADAFMCPIKFKAVVKEFENV